MKKNKLSIDLGNLDLTDGQLKSILSAVHKTVNTKVKSLKPATAKKSPGKALKATKGVARATITATFTNVDPGLSELRAKHKGNTQTLTQSGTLIFNNVNTGDIISIQGKSLGSADISIDVSASPPQMKFAPGTFNSNFFIL